MAQYVINASARELGAKSAVKNLRKNGGIPAVIYNRHGKVQHLALNARDFEKAIEGVSVSTIVNLKLGNKSYDCLVKDRQIDWLHGKILHVDFFEVESGVLMRAKVPVHLEGNAIGVRNGGILENPVHEVEVECYPKDMPTKFVLDINNLEANHSLHVKDIAHADSVKILSAQDQVIVLVKFAKAEEVAEAAPADAAAPAAAAATATPAAPAQTPSAK